MDDNNAQGALLLILAAYFIPAIVASSRHHRNRMAIGVLNLVAGWTVVGWIVAMVWACTADVEPKAPKPQYTTRWSRWMNKGTQLDPVNNGSQFDPVIGWWSPSKQILIGILIVIGIVLLFILAVIVISTVTNL